MLFSSDFGDALLALLSRLLTQFIQVWLFAAVGGDVYLVVGRFLMLHKQHKKVFNCKSEETPRPTVQWDGDLHKNRQRKEKLSNSDLMKENELFQNVCSCIFDFGTC